MNGTFPNNLEITKWLNFILDEPTLYDISS